MLKLSQFGICNCKHLRRLNKAATGKLHRDTNFQLKESKSTFGFKYNLKLDNFTKFRLYLSFRLDFIVTFLQ